MTQMANSSCTVDDAPVAVSTETDASRDANPAASAGTPNPKRGAKTKAERVAELHKLVGPGRRITAVLRRANGRFLVYTEPDTSDVTREISQADSLKQSSQSFIDIPLGSAKPMSCGLRKCEFGT